MKRAADAQNEIMIEHDKESPPKQARLEETEAGARPATAPPPPALVPTRILASEKIALFILKHNTLAFFDTKSTPEADALIAYMRKEMNADDGVYFAALDFFNTGDASDAAKEAGVQNVGHWELWSKDDGDFDKEAKADALAKRFQSYPGAECRTYCCL